VTPSRARARARGPLRPVLRSLAIAVALSPISARTSAAPAAALPDAAPRSVEVRAEKTTVRLGEPFGYEVEVRHAPEEWYLLRGTPPLEPFRAAEDARCVRVVEQGEARTTCTVRLALFALGAVDVPEVVLEVERPSGKARLAVPGPRIVGAGMLDPAADAGALALRDVAPPVPLLVRSLRPFWWALSILGGAALAAAAVALLVRRRARGGAPSAPGPAERFERRLSALAAEDLPRHGRGEEHIERLAEAVRGYLSSVTGLPALDLTTGELLAALARAPDPRIDAGGLELLLAHADLVKFARAPARPEACAAGLEYGWELLRRTRPPTEPSTARTSPASARAGTRVR